MSIEKKGYWHREYLSQRKEKSVIGMAFRKPSHFPKYQIIEDRMLIWEKIDVSPKHTV